MPDVSDTTPLSSIQQMEALLGISQAIATVQDRTDLLRVIYEQIKPVLPFDDAGIAILTADKNEYFEFLTAEALPSDMNQLYKQEGYDKRLLPLDMPIRKGFDAQLPTLIDVAREIRQYPNTLYLPLFEKVGIQQCIAQSLRVRGTAIGLINFNSQCIDQYSETDFPLFNAIADLVGVAVANILNSEEILAREWEKAKLLSISKAIAVARNAVELLAVIREKAQQLIPFYDTGILIVEPDGQYHYDLAVRVPGWDISEVNQQLQAERLDRVPHKDSYLAHVIEKIDDATTPVIEDWELVFEQFRHPFFPILKKGGYKQALVTTLKSGGKTIGTLWLNALEKNHFHPNQFDICQALADQIGVAVANILANEEILSREREKMTLLEITGLFALIRTRQELIELVNEQVRPLFGFNEMTQIMLLSDDGQWLDYFYTLPADEPRTQSTHADFSPRIPCRGMLQTVFQVKKPFIQDIGVFAEQAAKDPVNRPLVERIQSLGIKQIMIGLLQSRGQVIGSLHVHSHVADRFTDGMLPLFGAIVDQLAVAVANILANEAIDRQLREITTLKKRIEAENVYLQEEVKSLHNFEEIIGTSPALHDCLIKVGMVARTPSTVLIGGETGTGKELIARAIHNLSDRRGKPLIKINCAALPRELIESELFGHERGAFTGAIEKRIGKFELANGSTLFLDEIGELPLEVQAKLLRAIQEREIERLGGNRVITVDVRIIVATNRDLGREVQAGRFRADLFFRLNVFPITLPPLRDRRDDIPALAAYFVQKSAKKVGKVLQGISTKAMQSLLQYHFPGNIRELEHIIERGAILVTSRTIQELHLPVIPAKAPLAGSANPVIQTLAEQERTYILSVLEHCRGRVSGPDGAARLLGLPSSTLESKMKKLGIRREHVSTT